LGRVGAALPPEMAGIIRFDRHTRQALKVFPNETVTIEPAALEPTREITLVPGIDMSTYYNPKLVAQLKDALTADQTPVRAGMLLYLRPPGGLTGIIYDVHYVEG